MKLSTFMEAIKSLIGGLDGLKESHPIAYAIVMLALIGGVAAGVYFVVLV